MRGRRRCQLRCASERNELLVVAAGDDERAETERLSFLGLLEQLPNRLHRLRQFREPEEAVELSLACADGSDEEVVYEAADLLYHALVAARARGIGVEAVLAELRRRQS